MSYFLEGVTAAVLIALAYCIVDFVIITIEDAVDFHYSKKRGEI